MTLKHRTFVSALSLLLSALAVGCLPSLEGNPPREANKAVPGEFSKDSGKAVPAQAKPSAQRTWEDFFSEPELRQLVEIALKNNQELNIRLQEIIIAQTEVQAKKGEYLPKVSAGAGAGVERVGKNTSQGVSDEAHGLPENLGDFAFGLTGSWEVDVWKKLRNGAKAANYRYLATIEGRNFIVTELVAEIARSYYELIALDNQLEVLERNIAIQQDALEVVKLEKLAARVTQLAVNRFEAEVLKNRSRRFRLEQERVQAENRINFLVGRYPERIERNSETFKEPLPNVIQAGIPSELLQNRPDVRQAELELEASKLDVKAAKANFYPSLSIDAGVGYRSIRVECVGSGRPLVERDKRIDVSSQEGRHADLASEQGRGTMRDVERHIFLSQAVRPDGPGIVPAVPRVENHSADLSGECDPLGRSHTEIDDEPKWMR